MNQDPPAWFAIPVRATWLLSKALLMREIVHCPSHPAPWSESRRRPALACVPHPTPVTESQSTAQLYA